MRILIAEDDAGLAQSIKCLLEKEHYTVDVVHTGLDALYFCRKNYYDAIVMDALMPVMTGVEALSTIRQNGSDIPVIVLATKAEIRDHCRNLVKKADDYLCKPFPAREIVVRVHALLHRDIVYPDFCVNYGDACLDSRSSELSCGTRAVHLNNKEYLLAELFFRNPRAIFTINDLMNRVWGCDAETGTEVIWTYIGFLRKKIRKVESTVEIRTIRGAGYSLEDGRW